MAEGQNETEEIQLKEQQIPLEEQEADTQRQIEEQLTSQQNTDSDEIEPTNNQDYRTEPGPTVTEVVAGEPGGQPTYGTSFSGPGGFYWSEGGGPTVNVSVGFSVGVANLSFSLGNIPGSTSGVFIEVPSPGTYRLRITEMHNVQQHSVYMTDPVTGTESFDGYIYTTTLTNRSFAAQAQ